MLTNMHLSFLQSFYGFIAHCFLALNSIPFLAIPQLSVHLPVEGHLSCSQVWQLCAINIHPVQVFVWTLVFRSRVLMMILEIPPLGDDWEFAWALKMALALQLSFLEEDHQVCGLCISRQHIRIPLSGTLSGLLQPPRRDLSQEQSGISHF